MRAGETMLASISNSMSSMQVNLVSREELLAARANPEAYGDLVVRVGGFSDYYVRLAENLQVEILSRTEHEF